MEIDDMAGRPKTMAKKLTDLEETAYQLSIDVGKLCPHQYREWQAGWDEDTFGAVWYRAVAATKVAADAVDYVLGLAEERAYGEEAAEDMDSARDRRRGLWPLPSAADEGAEKAERAGA